MPNFGFPIPLLYSTNCLLLCLTLLLCACDPNTQHTQEKNTESAVYQLRLGHERPAASVEHQSALAFARLVEQRSGGELRISVHPAQELGTAREMIALVQAGQLDIVLTPAAMLSTVLPAMQLLDLPYLFNSLEQAQRVLQGSAGNALLAGLADRNLIGAAFWSSGFKQLTSDRPLTGIHDLAQLRVRIMPSSVLQDQFQSLGANTLSVDLAKTRRALADDIVDAQESPLGDILEMGFHEVQSHLYLSDHGYMAQVLALSAHNFAKLPLRLQGIVRDSAIEISQSHHAQLGANRQHLLDKLQEAPIRVADLPDTIRAQLELTGRRVLEKHRLNLGTGLVEQLLQALEEERQFSADELVIGLDADLAGNSALSGLSIRRGIELAIDEINAAGGVRGKRLILTARDNSMVSARGIANLDHFRTIPQLVAVIGGISSPVALSQLESIHQHGILYLDPWAAATGIVENGYRPNYVFRVSVRDEYAAGFLLEEAMRVSERIGLLLVNNGWGRSNHASLLGALEKQGGQLVDAQWFDWGETRFEAKLQSLADAGAEVIIYVGNPVEAAKFIQYMVAADARIPIVSHWGITGSDFPALVGQDLDTIDLRVLQTFSFIGNKSDAATRVIRAYRDKYGIESPRDIVAPTGTAHAYDLVHMLAKAIEQADSFAMSDIRDALEHLSYHQGLVRDYRPPFRPDHHDALSADDFIMARFQHGVIVPLTEHMD